MSTVKEFFSDNCPYKVKRSVYIMPEVFKISLRGEDGEKSFKYLMYGKSKSGNIYTWLYVIDLSKKIEDVIEVWNRQYGSSFPQ